MAQVTTFPDERYNKSIIQQYAEMEFEMHYTCNYVIDDFLK